MKPPVLAFSTIRESDGFQSLREPWNALWADLDNPQLFSSFDWCWNAWRLIAERRGCELRLVSGWLDGHLVLVWPMMIDSGVLRMLSSESGVSNHLIRAGMPSQKNWRDLADASSRLAKAKIYIDDTPGIDVMELRAKARRLKHEAALDLIMVDYLQLMSVKGKVESRNQEISQISRGLKAIAKELNCPLISLSQLSRRPEQRTGDHRPQLADLRESGSIEQDADLVAFIYRDEVYNKDTEEKGIAEIIIGKQRNGPIGDFKLVFRNDITKFFNYEPTPDYMPE